MTRKVKMLASACILASLPYAACAVDSVSVEIGSGNKTELARVGMQWKWERRWRQRDGTHIGGYWSAHLGQWNAYRYLNIHDNRKDYKVLGITPVFRLQNDNLLGLYGEAGVGFNYISDLYDNNDRQLSTKFQFGDHIGIGYVFANRLDVGLRYQHFSNGSIRQPNDGVNFVILRLSYPLK